MFNQVQDFVTEQMQAFAGRAQQFGADPLTAVREGAAYSADTLETVKQPVRLAARSSVQLSSLMQKTTQQLIELQSDMMTSSLTEIAQTLERAAEATDYAALVSAQAEAARKSAERLANDATRAMEIFLAAGRGVQQVAAETFEKAAKPVETATRARKPRGTNKAKAKAKAA
jgi:phasin family protein